MRHSAVRKASPARKTLIPSEIASMGGTSTPREGGDGLSVVFSLPLGITKEGGIKRKRVSDGEEIVSPVIRLREERENSEDLLSYIPFWAYPRETKEKKTTPGTLSRRRRVRKSHLSLIDDVSQVRKVEEKLEPKRPFSKGRQTKHVKEETGKTLPSG